MHGLIFHPEKCGGCRTCMLVCAMRNLKANNVKKSAIRIKSRFPDPGTYEIDVCRQEACENKPCIDACPSAAIGNNNGLVSLSAERCTLCLACANACPYHAILMHSDVSHVLHCNLCSGTPECVKWCPTEAIQIEELKV